MDNFIATPHLGASTEEAQRNASTMAAEGVLDVLQNRAPRYVVNMPVFDPEILEELSKSFHRLGSIDAAARAKRLASHYRRLKPR